MTIGTETVTANPLDQTTQAPDPNLTAAAAQGGGAPEVIDVDDASMQAALAAVQAEEAVATPPPEGTGTQAQPAFQPAARQEQPGRPPMPDLIPKPRFDEVNSRVEKLATENAYLKGQLDARTAPPAAQTQQAQPTPEQHLQAIASASDNLAKRFDDGEITMAEYKREERTLQSQENALRDQMRAPPQPAASNDTGNELYLETLTAQLETQHPWVAVFDQVGSPADWDYLKAAARQNLTERGVDVGKKSALATYELRKEVSRLADELGPSLVAAKAQKAGIQLPGSQTSTTQTPQAQQPKPLSQQAQARQAALTKAANAPPDITALNGYTGTEGGMPTDDQIANMSEEDIARLPQAVRNKAMGIT